MRTHARLAVLSTVVLALAGCTSSGSTPTSSATATTSATPTDDTPIDQVLNSLKVTEEQPTLITHTAIPAVAGELSGIDCRITTINRDDGMMSSLISQGATVSGTTCTGGNLDSEAYADVESGHVYTTERSTGRAMQGEVSSEVATEVSEYWFHFPTWAKVLSDADSSERKNHWVTTFSVQAASLAPLYSLERQEQVSQLSDPTVVTVEVDQEQRLESIRYTLPGDSTESFWAFSGYPAPTVTELNVSMPSEEQLSSQAPKKLSSTSAVLTFWGVTS